MTNEKLLPCPFCGKPPLMLSLSDSDDYGQIGCEHPDCRMQPQTDEASLAGAITAWNTRFSTPPGDDEVERVLERLREVERLHRVFVIARTAMNDAVPAIEATPAERALYDERYKADHAAERAMFRAAISFANDADEIGFSNILARAALTAIPSRGERRNPCAGIFDHKWLDAQCVATGCQSLVLGEALREAVIAAYIQGAMDVHNNWQEDRDPDFTEAAHDYASSLPKAPSEESAA